MAFPKNALMRIKKKEKIKLINNDCLLTLVLLCIMLHIMFALSNAVCLYYAFLPLIFSNAFCFHPLSWFIDT